MIESKTSEDVGYENCTPDSFRAEVLFDKIAFRDKQPTHHDIVAVDVIWPYNGLLEPIPPHPPTYVNRNEEGFSVPYVMDRECLGIFHKGRDGSIEEIVKLIDERFEIKCKIIQRTGVKVLLLLFSILRSKGSNYKRLSIRDDANIDAILNHLSARESEKQIWLSEYLRKDKKTSVELNKRN
jgi:hypothetical protein